MKHAAPILAFALLSLILTSPLIFHMTDHVPSDLGDPLFIIWLLSWSSHSFGSGLEGLWDGNVFYPHQKTLLYADHILGLSLLAAPVAALSGSFVFAFNFLFILSFFLCACGMYALVYHLTKSQAAALVSGIIFAFFPYRYAHISHLEILFFAWMAFLFLFLHRFFEDPSIRNLVGIGVFYVLQVLCCGYYGVYVTLFAALFVLFYAWKNKSFHKIDFWIKMALLFGIGFVILLPIYLPYFVWHKAMDFVRPIREVTLYSAQLQHFLSVPEWNALWGGLMGTEGGHEWQLYPGIITVVLVFIGVWKGKSSEGTSGIQRFHKIFYGIVAAVSILLAFGPAIRFFDHKIVFGPYLALYKWVPGFGSLRVPSRMFAITMLALSVLCGYGIVRLLDRVKSFRRKNTAVLAISLLILLDFASIPIPLAGIEREEDIPPIYATVKNLPAGSALIELPMPPLGIGRAYDAFYMYYSTFHWRPIVNGYCGYNPPGYLIVRDAMDVFPSDRTLDLLRDLEVTHVVVHTQGFHQDRAQEILKDLDNFFDQVRLVDQKKEDYLFEILPRDKPVVMERIVEGKEKWTATSNSNLDLAPKTIDGDRDTGWCTQKPLKEGDYFQLDLQSPREVGKIELFLTGTPLGYPRGYEILGSMDGTDWEILAENPNCFPKIMRQTVDRLSEYRVDISFESRVIRFLRIRQTGYHPIRRWWIHEIVLKH
jgi:hypothetical protein